jgi:hypothetical protein
LVEADLKSGVLMQAGLDWVQVFDETVKLAEQHTGVLGCRSLDVLHCAMAGLLGAAEFVSTDTRQKKLATAIGLRLTVI